MSITGAGSITAANIAAVTNMNNQLDTLSQELGTGEAASTYSGLGSQAGLALALGAQLSAIDGYSSTATTVGTTLSIAQSALTQIGNSSSAVAQAVGQDVGKFTLNGNGQTSTQAEAAAELGQILSTLNTQVGSNFIFSGSAVNQPSVASESAILNGSGSQAGLTQVIAERQQADVGTSAGGLIGRVATATVGSELQVAHDPSQFGFQLAGITSDMTNATITGPTGSPAQESINLLSNPAAGDTINFTFTLPDGSSQTVALTATTNSPAGTNQFTIGSDTTATASNINTALNSALSTLAQTALPAASAIEASNNFFANPPLRVDGPPFDTATGLVNGTSANTVSWYTGGSSSTPRQTAVAEVGPSTTIAYGMQANEPAISSIIANVAALAAATYSASDANAQASYQTLSQQVEANLSGQSGTQSISDIEADLANAQTIVTSAGTTNTQTQTTLQGMLSNIEGINQDQIGEQILTLQNSLSASLSVTARLAQISLVNYLGPASG
jgi:hypothetical protein